MHIYSLSIMLILVMDPLGNIPIFLSILRKFDHKRQSRIIIRESFIAFIVLVIFLFFGRYIMQGLQISTSALSVVGGIVLFMIAIRMVFPTKEKAASADETTEEPLIVPLAVPLTAGPSTLAVLMLYSSQHPGHTFDLLIAVIIASIVFVIIMLASRYLMKILGRRVLIAAESLMGMILTALAVQMLLSGIVQYLQVSKLI